MTMNITILGPAALATLIAMLASAPLARADIFQWEYINPSDPAQGKRQSLTLTPDGAGANAVPGADLSLRNLTMAYLTGADLRQANLTSAYFGDGALDNVDFRQANLQSANFAYATLVGANFAGAEVRGAIFSATSPTSFTAAQLYSTASYQAHELTGLRLAFKNLASWNFTGQNLTNASFTASDVTGAIFAGAEVRGASFVASGVTTAQLYSTASYQRHDLSGIRLVETNLANGNFAGQDLTGADLARATLTNADLSHSNLANANFGGDTFFFTDLSGANLSQSDLTGAHFGSAMLTDANLSQSNLTNTSFGNASLTGASFTGADVRGAGFNTLSAAQLYSTASYQARDLTSIRLFECDLTGINLAGQNLSNANFGDGFYSFWTNLSDADLSGADVRGASLNIPASAITANLIRSDGRINGLGLNTGQTLTVRDYDGDPDTEHDQGPTPIAIDQHFAMAGTGALRLEFDADPWDSTISFAPGIPVTLGGALELTFAADVNLASQIGRTIDLFDWTGVTPTGAFDVASRYSWDVSQLYTSGKVTLMAVPEPRAIVPIGIGIAMVIGRYSRRPRY